MNPLKHLLPHFLAQKRRFMLGVFFLLITNALMQALPLLLARAIDSLKYAPLHWGQAFMGWSLALSWACLNFLIVLSQAGTRFGWRWGFFGTSRRVEYGMRRALFDRLLALPPLFYARRRLGDLLSRAISDLSQLRESLGFGGMALIDSFSMILFTGIAMTRLDGGLALKVLFPLIAIPPLVTVLGRRVRDLNHKSQESLDHLSQVATESFRGARVIHAYAQAGAEAGRFEAACEEYRDQSMRLTKVEAVYWPLLTFFAGLSEVLLFYLGGARVARGEMSMGNFVAFNEYLLKLVWPVMALGFTLNLYVRGKVSLERLAEVMESPEKLEEAAPKAGAASGAAALEFEGILFSPGASPQPALKNFSLSLRAGEWMGLAGRTGSGKSSLLKLVPRLFDPQEGRLRVQGIDVRQWPLGQLRKALGLVEQEPFLFSDSILHNIALGIPGPDLQEAIRCSRLADLHDFIASLPQGYDSLLGEKGVNLSGGQKQRLALARALYRNPGILLLDDAFSSVDTATEERIAAALKKELASTTVLLVSHRLSTLFLCDQVAVLEGGRVAELGEPRELVQKEGFLFEMARREQAARRAGLSL